MSTEHGNIYFAFIILIIAFLVIKNTVLFLVIKVVKTVFNGVTCNVCDKDDKDCTAHCFYNELKVKALTAIYEKTCGEVQNFKEIQSKGLGKQDFAEQRFEEEPSFDYKTMLNTLMNKQLQIEGVINHHLEYLHGEGSLSNF